jgi:uncharacterized LabA/DUF88 family protein
MDNNYFFIDGSCLLGDIKRLKSSIEFKNKKFNIDNFYQHFSTHYRQFGSGYRRFTIYFVNGENRIKDQLILPNFKLPNQIEDFHVKYCGKKISGTKRVETWVNKSNPPRYVMDRFNKSEKAVDTQICCDALQLAAVNRLDRLFLYTNDYDFMPLIEVLKALGVNVSLIKLSSTAVNKDLVENSDSFCVPDKAQLKTMFV